MRKFISTLLLFIMILLLVSPVNIKALSVTEASQNREVISRLDNNIISMNYNPLLIGDGCANTLLGDTGDPNSVAWLLQQILDFIKVIGPILVVILSSIDFAKVIIKSDDEAMAKAQKKLIIRLILAALLFFIPVLVTVLLDLFGLTSSGTCGLN